ncbi:MAG: TatD family hydrolase [Bacteroidales bacterium]|nr:TatD family hydrolase [Bacteroidales bacterium]MBO7764357.1 TatD family hydrolase [Bacteroidales bacterium]
MIIDTHTHLYDADFRTDFDDVVLRARDAGVCKCIMPAIDISSFDDMCATERALEGFAYATIGLHPTSVKENWREELDFVKGEFARRDYCAVGEIGLDGYWSRDFIEEQKTVFYEQMVMAASRDIPVIIHLREATDDMYEVLERLKGAGVRPRGVFHAFSGSYETYERINRYGDFLVGIGGVVTYKKAGVASVVERLPLERMVLETDSPWLSPVPYRGKRNEPSYLKEIVAKIASLKGCDPALVEEVTTANAMKMFNIG